jgi:hypothetical protein
MRIRDHLAETGAPAFRFRQLIAAWQSSTAETFADVHALPAALRADLAERFGPRLHPLNPLEVQRDEQVEKVLFASETGARSRPSYRITGPDGIPCASPPKPAAAWAALSVPAARSAWSELD